MYTAIYISVFKKILNIYSPVIRLYFIKLRRVLSFYILIKFKRKLYIIFIPTRVGTWNRIQDTYLKILIRLRNIYNT